MQKDGVLVFSGYDPSGGAGILQDVHIIRQQGIYAFGIVTAMVYENTCRVDRVFPIDVDMQINLALEERIRFKVFKLGLIYSRRQLESILTLAKKLKPDKIVVDPIFFSSSKGQLSRLSPEDYLNFIKITDSILLPNRDEFHILFGSKSPRDVAMLYNTSIILKAYRIINSQVIDLLVTEKGDTVEFKHKKMNTQNIHGTGCTIASLLAANLFHTNNIKEAYSNALRAFEDIIKNTIDAGCQKIII